MITGDYHHTALSVAKQTGMLPAAGDIIIVDTCKQGHLQTQQSLTKQAAVLPSSSHPAAAAPPVTPQFSPQSSQCIAERDLPEITRLLSSRTSDLQSLRARLVNLERVADETSSRAGLSFASSHNNQEMEQTQALTALAEGRAQCAVTGSAFQSLLQQQDLHLLEVVLRSAVVFARMQPHQKGQVMDLMTVRGIHLQTDGASQYVPVSDCWHAASDKTVSLSTLAYHHQVFKLPLPQALA